MFKDMDRVMLKDIEVPNTKMDRVMQRAAFSGRSAAPIIPMLHGVVDMIPTNKMVFTQFDHLFFAHDEQTLFQDVMKHVTGKGSTDHPRIQSFITHTLGDYPDLLSLYNRY